MCGNSNWEMFGPNDLITYLSKGVKITSEEIVKLLDHNRPYTKADEQSLRFMVESLLQARRIRDEILVIKHS